MSKYVVKSDRAQTVPGLGVFEKDEEREFTEQDAAGFQMISGLPLADGNVPEGVKVTKRGGRASQDNVKESDDA